MITVVITADDKQPKSGKMKAWNPQQLNDAEQVAFNEEDPSPVNTVHMHSQHMPMCPSCM